MYKVLEVSPTAKCSQRISSVPGINGHRRVHYRFQVGYHNSLNLIFMRYSKSYCYILTFDPAPKNAIPRWYTGRKWHIPMASNRKKSRGQIKAYDMGQGEGPIVPLQWCTGREWPLNCMTVVSAWWRLNIRFQRSSRRSCGCWIII